MNITIEIIFIILLADEQIQPRIKKWIVVKQQIKNKIISL